MAMQGPTTAQILNQLENKPGKTVAGLGDAALKLRVVDQPLNHLVLGLVSLG